LGCDLSTAKTTYDDPVLAGTATVSQRTQDGVDKCPAVSATSAACCAICRAGASRGGPTAEKSADATYPNLIYFNEVDKGGHFAAWEQPELFSAELRAGFRPPRT
jgi:hypothetical protein